MELQTSLDKVLDMYLNGELIEAISLLNEIKESLQEEADELTFLED